MENYANLRNLAASRILTHPLLITSPIKEAGDDRRNFSKLAPQTRYHSKL